MPTPPMLRADRSDRRNVAPRHPGPRVRAALTRVLAAAALVVSPGCLTHERPDAGKAPEGQIRVPGGTRRPKGDGGADDGPVAPASSVIAVVTTGIYHRDNCTILAESAPESRVPFGSPWLALDAGHTPCSHCRPGP